MKVYHLNTDEGGGAARAAMRLHLGLRSLGLDSTFCVKRHDAGVPSVKEIVEPGVEPLRLPPLPLRVLQKIKRRVLPEPPRPARPRRITYASEPTSHYRPAQFAELGFSDIYNLHWVAHLLDWESTLPWLAEQAPLVWTLHDLNPMMGIWHYEPTSEDPVDEWRDIDECSLQIKERALAKIPDDRLIIISPSHWIAKQASRSQLLSRFETRVIPYGLDTNSFVPMNKAFAKRALGLPSDKLAVGFAGGSLDPRKGGDLLAKCFQRIDREVIELSVGVGRVAPHPCRVHLGLVEDDRLMRLFYAAADVFICPSRQDNLPNTVLEAMACGTAVIGADVGGIPDMVRPGHTGWLFPSDDAEELTRVIKDALDDPARLCEYGSNSRRVCEQEYTLEVQAKAYAELYKELLARKTKRRVNPGL